MGEGRGEGEGWEKKVRVMEDERKGREGEGRLKGRSRRGTTLFRLDQHTITSFSP